jgi:hypothetical protein
MKYATSYECVPRAVSPEIKWPERECAYSPISNDEAENTQELYLYSAMRLQGMLLTCTGTTLRFTLARLLE